MTDRELLEFAAKATGVDLAWSTNEDQSPRNTDGWLIWNPLTDDGDALRLAVKLRLEIFIEANNTVNVCQWFDGKRRIEVDECTENIYAATRRAIVRAAAEIAHSASGSPSSESPAAR